MKLNNESSALLHEVTQRALTLGTLKPSTKELNRSLNMVLQAACRAMLRSPIPCQWPPAFDARPETLEEQTERMSFKAEPS